jgi:hypothetical protein
MLSFIDIFSKIAVRFLVNFFIYSCHRRQQNFFCQFSRVFPRFLGYEASSRFKNKVYIRLINKINKQIKDVTCILKGKNRQFLLNKKSICNHTKKFLVNNVNNGRNACILFDAHVADRKHSSSPFFEIYQPPDDPSWMKQDVVANF